MTGKTFHEGPFLVPRLKSRNLQPVGDRELAVVKRGLRCRDQFGEGNATFLCCAPDYVADERQTRTWADIESMRTKHN